MWIGCFPIRSATAYLERPTYQFVVSYSRRFRFRSRTSPCLPNRQGTPRMRIGCDPGTPLRMARAGYDPYADRL